MAEERGSRQAPASQGEDRPSALLTNAHAIQAVASAVAGTLGPKGLNCMLVDSQGDVTITNDGSTILNKIEVSHPAARLLIHAAQAQEREVGDGTTTATLLASALIEEAVRHVSQGVPVMRLLEGMRDGIECALEAMEGLARRPQGLEDALLRQAAFIAGRAQADIADLVVEAARLVGEETLRDPSFRLADLVRAQEGEENAVVQGLVVRKERMNRQMPAALKNVRVLVVDDSLEPETLGEEALATEAGFRHFMELQEQFQKGLRALIEAGVRGVFVERAIDPLAEEMLTEAGAFAVRRVSSADLCAIAEHTGACLVKRTVLKRPVQELEKFLGYAACVVADERRGTLRITGGRGKPAATIVVGASTREVCEERERIARNAAAAVQGVVVGGALPGGGAAELAAARAVQRMRGTLRGMVGYGADCVVEALKTPLMQIVANAGFNPLEKVEDALAAQAASDCAALAIECDRGEVANMFAMGIVDPLPVKRQALRTAFEVAEAILRISTIIKKRPEPESSEAR